MFKLLKKLFLLIFIILLAIIGTIIYSGYNMYDKAISEISLENRVKQIQREENYTNLVSYKPINGMQNQYELNGGIQKFKIITLEIYSVKKID